MTRAQWAAMQSAFDQVLAFIRQRDPVLGRALGIITQRLELLEKAFLNDEDEGGDEEDDEEEDQHPPPDVIRTRCQEVQAEWSEDVRLKRLRPDWRSPPWTVPSLRVCEPRSSLPDA